MTRSLPPVVITGSRMLRAELRRAEQHCGLDFDYHDTLPAARRYAVRRQAIILGGDLLPLVRKPWRCRGIVLAVILSPITSRLLQYGQRAGVTYTIELPAGSPVLIDAIGKHTAVSPPRPAQRSNDNARRCTGRQPNPTCGDAAEVTAMNR